MYVINNNSFIMFSLSAPNRTEAEVTTLMQPVLDALTQRNIAFQFLPRTWPTFLDYFAADFGPLPYGSFVDGVVMSSRLIPRSVGQNQTQNAAVIDGIRKATAMADLGFYVGCTALDVSNASPVADNAVLPGLARGRDPLYLHLAMELLPATHDP